MLRSVEWRTLARCTPVPEMVEEEWRFYEMILHDAALPAASLKRSVYGVLRPCSAEPEMRLTAWLCSLLRTIAARFCGRNEKISLSSGRTPASIGGGGFGIALPAAGRPPSSQGSRPIAKSKLPSRSGRRCTPIAFGISLPGDPPCPIVTSTRLEVTSHENWPLLPDPGSQTLDPGQ